MGELSLIPPRYPNERLFVWLDMRAVKSTGPGHGSVLPTVGTTAAALIAWLRSDPDFQISEVAPSTLIHGVATTRLVVGVSRSARYGDRECPSNPRCAAIFTNPTYWGTSFYAIGAPEQTQLYVGAIRREGATHNFLVALDAEGPRQLRRLVVIARPIIASLRLPNGTVGA